MRSSALRYLELVRYQVIESPIGPLTLVWVDGGLRSIRFGRDVPHGAVEDGMTEPAIGQLLEYFDGRRMIFDVPLALEGTPFQLSVWNQLMEIPHGETRSYGEIAAAIGKPGAARAVGMANHNNPIPIIVPCHRVVGHDGSLTGYGGGLEVKAQLLALERALSTKEPNATSPSTRGRSTATQSALFV